MHPYKEPDNLDNLDIDELKAVAHDRDHHPRIKELASALWFARKSRLDGNIAGAMQHEKRADRLYRELPEFLKVW